MLDKFATLHKKRCNNQFVVAQRKPLGCVQAGCVSPCSLTQPGVPIKTRHQLMHNVGCGWKVCWLQQPLWKVINLCPISRFCPKIGSFKILNWLVTWLLIFFFLFSLSFLLLFLKKQPSHSAAYLTVAFYVIPTILLIYCFQTAELRIPSFLACNQNLAIVANL